MNIGKYVFSQVVLHLPARIFDRCVARYSGNKYVKHFTCWNQLLCMMFGQISGRDSLRDLLISIGPHRPKYYHLGFGKNVTRSNLQLANERRDSRIYEEFAYAMIDKARSCATNDEDFKLDISGPVYAIDSTLIDLCLNVFWWAGFRTAKGAVKIHTLMDIKTSIPCFLQITDGTVHDVNFLDLINYENGGFYVLDRAYLDFERLFKINSSNAYFVTRPRSRFDFKWISSRKVSKKTGVLCDQTISLNNFYPAKKYPIPLRRIRYYDKDTNKRFVFISNNFELPAEEIALLYKYRWKIELLFKWIKQHLRITSFWGTTANAVRIQIYCAIITYTLMVIIKNKLKSPNSTYEILQILSISLLDKEPLKSLLNTPVNQHVKEQKYTQLNFGLFFTGH